MRPVRVAAISLVAFSAAACSAPDSEQATVTHSEDQLGMVPDGPRISIVEPDIIDPESLEDDIQEARASLENARDSFCDVFERATEQRADAICPDPWGDFEVKQIPEDPNEEARRKALEEKTPEGRALGQQLDSGFGSIGGSSDEALPWGEGESWTIEEFQHWEETCEKPDETVDEECLEKDGDVFFFDLQ